MSDRELLEKAARASGIRVIVDGDRLAKPHPIHEEKPGTTWNPIEDDGDALRLMVDCNLYGKHSLCTALGQENERCEGDYRAATRRAIVRAAAAMVD